MAKWKIYIKWASVKEVHPIVQLQSGILKKLIFYCKKDAENYFNESIFKDYKDSDWINEYEIKKVGE